MIYSNERKRCLCGWLHQNSRKAYDTALKLQKFLHFYECFSKVFGEKADFGHLRGYKRGSVFVRFGEITPRNGRRLTERQMRVILMRRMQTLYLCLIKCIRLT